MFRHIVYLFIYQFRRFIDYYQSALLIIEMLKLMHSFEIKQNEPIYFYKLVQIKCSFNRVFDSILYYCMISINATNRFIDFILHKMSHAYLNHILILF